LGSGAGYVYEPAAGYEGWDSFTYKAWDGFTYSATATVTIRVEDPPPVPLEVAGLGLGAAGLEVSVRGEPGRAVVIEFSGDVRTWTPVATVLNPSGTAKWVDPEWAGRGAGFYRAREGQN